MDKKVECGHRYCIFCQAARSAPKLSDVFDLWHRDVEKKIKLCRQVQS